MTWETFYPDKYSWKFILLFANHKNLSPSFRIKYFPLGFFYIFFYIFRKFSINAWTCATLVIDIPQWRVYKFYLRIDVKKMM